MSYTNYQAALDTHLLTVPGIPAVQLENTANIARTGVPFARGTLIPSRPTVLTVGINGTRLMQGLYQIDLFLPMNIGAASANALADAVINTFAKGLVLIEASSKVHITQAWREAGSRQEMFYSVPIVVSWTALAA